MDINYNMLWFEDTDEAFDTLSRRIKHYIESKNLICKISRIHSEKEFDLKKFPLNNYEVLVIDLRLANDTFGYNVIQEIRSGHYVNDVLFYSAEGEKRLVEIMKEYQLEGVFISDRDNKEFIPKLEKLIDKSVRRAENVINIRGIVMDITSEFDSNMVDIMNISRGLLSENEIDELKKYICSELLRDKKHTTDTLLEKYSLAADWKLSDILEEREFTSMMKARLLNKLLNLPNENIRSSITDFDDTLPEINKDGHINFYSLYNDKIIQFRNALAHVKSTNQSAGGPIFIKKVGDKEYYCDSEFCMEIRSSLINFAEFFTALYKTLESI